MRTLTEQEKRTIRIAGIGLAAYIVLFGGYKAWQWMDTRRVEYRKITTEAQNLKQKIQPYENKALLVAKLMEDFRLDPMQLSKTTLVANCSLAIQRAAVNAAVQLGPIRESSAKASAKEMATIQLEASGLVANILSFIQHFQSIGYPVVIEAIQLNPDPSKPGGLKLHLTVVILDFTQWKSEATHA